MSQISKHKLLDWLHGEYHDRSQSIEERTAYRMVYSEVKAGTFDESPDLIRTALTFAQDALHFMTLPHPDEDKVSVAKEGYKAVKSVLGMHDKRNPPVDYQQRYEALVQALRDGYSDSETAAGLIAWVESTTGIELWEDDSNEVATD